MEFMQKFVPKTSHSGVWQWFRIPRPGVLIPVPSPRAFQETASENFRTDKKIYAQPKPLKDFNSFIVWSSWQPSTVRSTQALSAQPESPLTKPITKMSVSTPEPRQETQPSKNGCQLVLYKARQTLKKITSCGSLQYGSSTFSLPNGLKHKGRSDD
jgi:hypothetical protein